MHAKAHTTYGEFLNKLVWEDIPRSEVESILDQLLEAGTEIPRDKSADVYDTVLTEGEVALVQAALKNGGDAVGLCDILDALEAAGINGVLCGREVRVGDLFMSPASTAGGAWCFGVDTLSESGDRYEWFATLAEAVERAKIFAARA